MCSGSIALACTELEAECILLMCMHAARSPSQLCLVKTVLEACALQLGYPNRAAYVESLAWVLVSEWFVRGNSLQSLLGIQVFDYIKLQNCFVTIPL